MFFCTDDEAFLRFPCPFEVLLDNKTQYVSQLFQMCIQASEETHREPVYKQFRADATSLAHQCATFEQMFIVSLSFPAGCYQTQNYSGTIKLNHAGAYNILFYSFVLSHL